MRRRDLQGTYRELCDCLAEARIALDLSQTELARRLGKPQSFVSKYESGERRLDAVEFFIVCDELGVDVRALWKDIKGDG